MVIQGVWPIFTVLTVISMVGLLFTGAYILKAIGKVLHGPMNEEWKGHSLEINRREILAIAPLMILMLFTGVWPSWIVTVINATVLRWFG
jgi:NADH-quinone oxidoreductase subunit M